MVSFWVLGLHTAGSPLWVFVIAIINAVLGVGLGLLASAFARTEFQAVQFMPLLMVPQLLLAGVIVPRSRMPHWLQWISNAMPASYALEALQQVGAHSGLSATTVRDIVVVLCFAVASLCLAAATLRRTDSIAWHQALAGVRDGPPGTLTPGNVSWTSARELFARQRH